MLWHTHILYKNGTTLSRRCENEENRAWVVNRLRWKKVVFPGVKLRIIWHVCYWELICSPRFSYIIHIAARVEIGIESRTLTWCKIPDSERSGSMQRVLYFVIVQLKRSDFRQIELVRSVLNVVIRFIWMLYRRSDSGFTLYNTIFLWSDGVQYSIQYRTSEHPSKRGAFRSVIIRTVRLRKV